MKNTLCIENYGVVPMTTREMKAIEGGWLWLFTGTTGDFLSFFNPNNESGSDSEWL